MITVITACVWIGVAAVAWLAFDLLLSLWDSRLKLKNINESDVSPKQSPAPKLARWQHTLWIVALLGVPVCCYGYVRSLSQHVDRDLFKSERAAEERLVNDWLNEQQKGHDTNTTRFWSDESWVRPTKFFAVRNWEIVDSDYGQVTVRVESSNGLHQPIVALWNVHLKQMPEKSGNWKMYSVEDVDKQNK